MSTRGCIIELKKDVCKVGYLHYGANFASKLIHYGMLGLTFTERCSENGYRDGTERGSGGSILSRNQ